MAHPHAELIARFYDALTRQDGDAMADFYHPEVTFQDEVFKLQGAEAGMMWRMLCERSQDLQVVATRFHADDTTGSAHWNADYTFSKTGHHVHNEIDSAFTFNDGLIASHVDRFNFWRWSRQALGTSGLLLGWTPWLRAKVKAEARGSLDAYIAKRGGLPA